MIRVASDQLLVNKFTVLKVEEYTENKSNLANTPVCSLYASFMAIAKCPK